MIQEAVPPNSFRRGLLVFNRLLPAALAGWGVFGAIEFTLLFGVLPLFAMLPVMELLPSLKVVLDMGAFAACGWTAGRLGRPLALTAAALAAAGFSLFALEPYVPLNFPWLVRLTANAIADSRYIYSLLTTLFLHALMFGSLFGGAYLSRPREGPMGLRLYSGDVTGEPTYAKENPRKQQP